MHKQSVMTLAQALTFLIYYAVSQAMLVAVVAFVFGLAVGWERVLSAFGLLACCGPVFLALIYWFREARDRSRTFAIRFGLSMSAMVVFYLSAVTFGARSVGLPFVSPAALPGYLATAILFGTPVFSFTAYLLSRRQIDSSGNQRPPLV
jgi:hypothetical protein